MNNDEQIEHDARVKAQEQLDLKDIHYYWARSFLTPTFFEDRVKGWGNKDMVVQAFIKSIEKLDPQNHIGLSAEEVFKRGCKKYGIKV